MRWQDSRDVNVARSATTMIAIAVAVILVVGGLAVIGAYVLLFIAMSNFGSNK